MLEAFGDNFFFFLKFINNEHLDNMLWVSQLHYDDGMKCGSAHPIQEKQKKNQYQSVKLVKTIY